MKKSFTAMLFFLIVSVCGCKNGGNGNMIIMATLERTDIYGSAAPVIMYSAQLMDFSTFSYVAGATVTVSGPGRVTTMSEIATGNFMFTSSDPLDYQYGQNYTVDVSVGGASYSASAAAPGSITFTAGCLVMNWTYDGNYNLVQVTDPSLANHQFGPAPSSTKPFDMNAHNAFSYGSGGYSVLVNVAKNISGAFPGAHFSSTLLVENNLGGIPVTK